MKNRRMRRWILGGLVPAVALLVACGVAGHRKLTPTERQCVGSWSFTLDEQPATLFVYRFHDDGRVTEEHYYLTSANPTSPRLRMHGVWRIESDGRLIVDRPGGIDGVLTEAARRIQRLCGRREYEHRLCRRIYKLVSADAATLSCLVNRRTESGQYEETELVMKPFTGVPPSAP
jgi:hypothetical protein